MDQVRIYRLKQYIHQLLLCTVLKISELNVKLIYFLIATLDRAVMTLPFAHIVTF
jgi:hypothetical protein